MKKGVIFVVGAAALTLSRLCAAGPADYVNTPAVEYGEREIDFKAGRANTHDADQSSAASLGFGFVVELERPQDHSEGYEVRFGPLFQTDIGKVQLNGNLLFGRNYRTAASEPMQFG